MKKAYLYQPLKEKKVRCDLCSHRCLIGDNGIGKCCVRKNEDGVLYSLVYRKLISENVDPIEKKPLFHFLPGTNSLSIATAGCNFKCFFCQNWQISQMPCDDGYISGEDRSPEEVVEHAVRTGCKSISYTYTEPTVYFEYAYDTAKIASKNGLKNIFVTNGFMTGKCIEMMDGYLDAANIDLKSFSEKTYRDKIGGRLKPVLENITDMHGRGIWIELTTLLIPGMNDSDKEIGEIAGFIADLDKSIPWHLSAYYPQYKSDIPATDVSTVKRAIDIGQKAGLKYIYGGNVYGDNLEDTRCPGCGTVVIARNGYEVTSNTVTGGKCPECGEKLDGRF